MRYEAISGILMLIALGCPAKAGPVCDIYDRAAGGEIPSGASLSFHGTVTDRWRLSGDTVSPEDQGKWEYEIVEDSCYAYAYTLQQVSCDSLTVYGRYDYEASETVFDVIVEADTMVCE